jgi:tetratricopeptide (TPR) repeat protein
VGPERDELTRDGYRWARAAGDRAAVLWLAVEAARWYRHALRLGDASGAPVAERADVARSLVRVSFGTEPSEAAEEVCRRALALFEEAGDDLGAGWAHAWLILVLLLQSRDEEARDHGERAVALLEPLGETRELAEAIRLRGQFHWRLGEMVEAEADSRRAAGIAERVGAADIHAAATQDLGVELSQTGRREEALVTMEEAFRLAREAGDRINLQRMYNNFAATLTDYASDLPRARAIALEGLEMAQRAGGTGWLAWIEGTLGEIELKLGDLDAAEALLAPSLEHAIAAGDEPLVGTRQVVTAQLALLRGSIDGATEALARADEIFGARVDPQVTGRHPWVHAQLALADGNEDEAVTLLWRGAESLDGYSTDQDPQVVLDLVRLLVQRGEIDEAARAREILARGRSPYARACLEVADALLGPDAAAAVTLLTEAADHLEALGNRVDLALALVDLGRAQRGAGEDPTPTFERARKLFVECGAEGYLPLVDAELSG